MQRFLTIAAAALFTGFASAQSPSYRTEQYQNETIRVLGQRLDDHDKAILQLMRGSPPQQTVYQPPAYSAPTYQAATPTTKPRVVINNREVTTQDKAFAVILAYAVELDRTGRPFTPPSVVVYNPPPTFKGNDVIQVRYTNAPVGTAYPVPATVSESGGTTVRIGSLQSDGDNLSQNLGKKRR